MSIGGDIYKGGIKEDCAKSDTEITRRELLQQISPLGKAELDSSRCTGCGLCVLACPTEALVISSGAEAAVFKIIFQQGNCWACGQCVEICPEKCLQVERSLELHGMGSQSVLFEDRLVSCVHCGIPLGPKSMIDNLQAKIKASGKVFPCQFTLCPDCKVRSQFRVIEDAENGCIA